jgi:hypothetical protein
MVFKCFVCVFTCILASSRITRSGSWKTDPSILTAEHARRAASVARPSASGYGTSHDKVFTVSTQGAVNLPDMVESSNLKQGKRATEGAELTGAVNGVGAQRQ